MDGSLPRCVLFADICDSSSLYRELGDSRARDFVGKALSLAGQSVVENKGSIIDTIGDEVFCVLPNADDGLRAAIRIHEKVAAARCKNDLPIGLGFRIGIVFGPVHLKEEQVFGDTVYLAKRVSNEAKFEEILLTARTYQALDQPKPELFRPVGSLRLKGRIEKVDLIEAIWSSDTTMEVAGIAFEEVDRDGIELTVQYLGAIRKVSAVAPVLTLGRGEHCNLVIADHRVSRIHARVEFLHGKFVWMDQSRNGSVIQISGRPPRSALRSKAPLEGSGTILLGPDDSAPAITFAIQDQVG